LSARGRYAAKKTVGKAERAWFLDRQEEESEAWTRVRFPRWGKRTCFRVIYLILAGTQAIDKICPKVYLKTVKNKIVAVLLTLLLTTLITSAALSPQEEKKTKNDYMSTILSRNTEPLGLKENPGLQALLEQPSIKWAVRSGRRQILH
jgi:hypothetical protein